VNGSSRRVGTRRKGRRVEGEKDSGRGSLGDGDKEERKMERKLWERKESKGEVGRVGVVWDENEGLEGKGKERGMQV